MLSPNTNNLNYNDIYLFNTSISGVEIYNIELETVIKYITYAGGLNSVWADENYAYLATPDDGLYRLDLSTIDSVSGMDLTSYITAFKQYPEITGNDVKYVHGCGDYLCLVTVSGVDHLNLGNSQAYTRSSAPAAAEKCFQTCGGRFYYTSGTKVVAIYNHSCDWSVSTIGYEYDSTASGTILFPGSTVKDIFVVEGASSFGSNNSLIFVATSVNVVLIEERTGDEPNSNYKYYSIFISHTVAGDRALSVGGLYDMSPAGNVNVNVIDYFSISATSDATDFGDLTAARRILYATSNGTNERGVFGGGYISANSNIIDYVTISSPSNAIDFGDLTVARQSISATSNSTNNRGVWGGGYTTVDVNVIDYITISTTGNASYFGDLTAGNARRSLATTSNGTNNRGTFIGGYNGTNNFNVIDYITISTTGNATDLGDLTFARRVLAATSDNTNNRAIVGGGYISAASNVIDYFTISTTGNALDFGDLSMARSGLAGASNGVNERGVFMGGILVSCAVNIIDYINISSLGNAVDFGDITQVRRLLSATSDA